MQRIKVVLVLLYVVVFVIIAKLAYVQLIDGRNMEDRALSNRLKQIEVKANRGIIYDRNDNALAISVDKESVYINPQNIRKAKSEEDPADNKQEIIKSLAEVMEMDVEKIEELVAKDAQFVWVKRQADDDKVERLRELGLTGVGFVPEPERVYPKGTLASHVIGFAGVDNQGLNGIEMKYEEQLKGKSGRLLIEYDNLNNEIPQALQEFIPAEAGYDLHLTIDETIQYIVEREISKVYLEQEAQGVTCVMMDVKTGGILAMANMPNFDPNNYGEVESSVWNNFAVSGVYEPGSTFKILSASMYLDDAVTRPEDNYYCSSTYKMGNDPTPIKCHIYPRGHGAETFAQAVANSCNPVMAELVLKLGNDAFYEYMEAFGLREKTGIDVPGEAIGIMLSKERATVRDYGAMAIGQTNAFTPIQMVTAISAVANGGYLMTPYVVDRITDQEGNVVEQKEPHVVRQVISEKTAKEMWGILEQVVSTGTGKKGQIEGYKVAGKTGTAQKVVDGKYVSGVDIVSFAGFAPADNPQIACIVIVDEPKHEKMGGLVAGPVFSNIMSDTLRYLNVPKTVVGDNIQQSADAAIEKVSVPNLGQMNAMEAINAFLDAGLNPIVQTQGEEMYAYLPPAGTEVDKGSAVLLYCKNPNETSATVPDLTGKTIRECDRILSGLGYRLVAEGSGVARRQQPEAGTLMESGGSVYVTFATTGQELEEADLEAADDSEQPAQDTPKNKDG